MYKTGKNNQNHKNDTVVKIPLIIASGGNGADNASYKVDGIDGLCFTSENRDDYGGYKSNGQGGRGASFRNDFNTFKSYAGKNKWDGDCNKCNPISFLAGAVGGKQYENWSPDGGFGGGGSSRQEGGAGGGYIGGLVSQQDSQNTDPKKYSLYGALSYNCCDVNHEIVMISGQNNGDGKIQVQYWSQ